MVTQSSKSFVSLDEVKDFLNISDTNSDSILGSLIAGVSAQICLDCNRSFEYGTYTDYIDGDHDKKFLFLKEYPVASITSIHDDIDRDYGSDALIDSEDYAFDPESGTVKLEAAVARGIRNVKVIYVAGYDPMPDDLKYACLAKVAARFLASRTQVSTREGMDLVKKRIEELEKDYSRIIEKYRRPAGYG